jgi:predicted RNA binding protein YcfA (HicA-like mRNA interferase family)
MKPVPIKKFRKFLKSIGLTLIRTESSHEIYNSADKPLLRPVTVDSNYSEVPILHIKTNLRTIGMSSKEFKDKIKNL